MKLAVHQRGLIDLIGLVADRVERAAEPPRPSRGPLRPGAVRTGRSGVPRIVRRRRSGSRGLR